MAKNSSSAKHNKITLWLLMLVFVGPSLIAATLYLYREHLQFKTVEKGQILSPPIDSQTLPFFKTEYLGKWQLIYVSPTKCDTQCETSLATLKQIQTATGKEQPRVEYRGIPAPLIPILKPGDIAIIDPRGWLMMQYPSPADPLGILKDLKRLLRLSHVG